jgi:acetoin utilization deacetylase AcuC-like enzyme
VASAGIDPLLSTAGRGWRDHLRLPWRRRRLPLFYSPGYSFALPATPLDPLRAEKILTALTLTHLLPRDRIMSPEPATLRELLQIHTDAYLESLAEVAPLARAFGMPVTHAQRERALAVQRVMTGGTLAAARRALGGACVTVNLGGGLHHAHRDRGQGFCLFNDVAVAIASLRADGFDRPILVVDLDVHDGDGTRAIFAADPTVYTFSIHNRHWDEPTAVASTAIELGSEVGDDTYLQTLRETLPPVVSEHRPGLVFYLAGCDPAADDKLGDWKVTAAGMLARDRFVHQTVRERAPWRQTPLVVLLAGGYGEHAWRYTARFVGWLTRRSRRPAALPSDDEVLLARYRAVSRLFSPAELTGTTDDDDWGLTAEDVFGVLDRDAQDPRFLGYYSQHGVELVLEKSGVLDRLRDLGYRRPRLELELTGSSGGHTLRVWGGAGRRELLVEARLRRDRQALEGFELLAVDWLLLQHPRGRFTPARPALPGQSHPGLGLLRDAVALLVQVCHRLHLDGLTFTPGHYHLAAQSNRYLRFLHPEDAATFDAVADAVAGLPLAAATRAVEEGRVVDAKSRAPLRWRPMPMVLVVSEALMQRFEAGYEQRRAEARAGLAFRLDGLGEEARDGRGHRDAPAP